MSTATAPVLEPPASPGTAPASTARARSLLALVGIWLVLHLGCLFAPGLLDDVDSVYIEVAREMNLRHDYVTPYIDGIRFFDKPPLLYWMAAGSMRLFGAHDWAARLPLSLCVLGLFFAVYALGKRLFGERGGFYAALAMATSLGPYLFTRFYIPDILNALWMTLGVHLFLIALDRVRDGRSTVAPTVWFSIVMALNLLTKGLIGVVFPIGFVVLYALCTRQLSALRRMHPVLNAAVFCAVALPWHILAALRNPAIPMPAGTGLPARAGWFWFYVINEHFLRFQGKRIPHDYGQVPIPIFWSMFVLWLMPWSIVLPAALSQSFRIWQHRTSETFLRKQSTLTLVLWSGMVLGFFTLSSRQEYYSLPALPALALMAGGVLAAASADARIRRSILLWTQYLLLPLCLLIAVVCGTLGILSHPPAPGTDISEVLSTSSLEQYQVSLGHLHDLTTRAMGFFRAPLLWVAVGMLIVGPAAWWLRRRSQHHLANLTMSAGMVVVLLCVHSGLARFYPILGSREIAQEVNQVLQPNDRLMVDGELVLGSSMLFYTQHPMLLVNGRVNGPWFGSFWPDAPPIFATEADLHRAWTGPERIFLLTYEKGRAADLGRLGPTRVFAASGGKLVLTNR
ncbi:ArnT family glycosyltransferase [Terriglobus aquaticus]|uniref:ArnT family glycosyltransferase n=1 Tax=Terriglobus aquaticus TaxID=940139 RepID=A0ABW9KHA2_9BACT|nr:glycosyltransferase family 39 protein [Terriglobus aquaticus]